jgi:hypothetical protein
VGDAPLTDQELDSLERLVAGASPDPWEAFAGPGIGGPDFIRFGKDEEMYVQHGERPAPPGDLDFIAAARNYLPRLLAEVRRCRSEADDPGGRRPG